MGHCHAVVGPHAACGGGAPLKVLQGQQLEVLIERSCRLHILRCHLHPMRLMVSTDICTQTQGGFPLIRDADKAQMHSGLQQIQEITPAADITQQINPMKFCLVCNMHTSKS